MPGQITRTLDLDDVRLSVTCGNCKTEFIFEKLPVGGLGECPVCGAGISKMADDGRNSELWKALSCFNTFRSLASQCGLKLIWNPRENTPGKE